LGGILNQMPVTTQGWNLAANTSELLRGHSIFLAATEIKARNDTRQRP
jgi:hypothetical protein